MPNSGLAEVYFIAVMMLLILVICVVAVYFFFKTFYKEKGMKEKLKEIEAKRRKEKADRKSKVAN